LQSHILRKFNICLCRWRRQKSVKHLLFTCWSCTLNSFKMCLLIQIKHVHFLIKLLRYLSRAAWHFVWKVKQTFNTWSSVTAAQSSSVLMLIWLIKFPYNARSDWLKERALSENRARVDDGKFAFKFLLRNFDKFAPN